MDGTRWVRSRLADGVGDLRHSPPDLCFSGFIENAPAPVSNFPKCLFKSSLRQWIALKRGSRPAMLLAVKLLFRIAAHSVKPTEPVSESVSPAFSGIYENNVFEKHSGLVRGNNSTSEHYGMTRQGRSWEPDAGSAC